MFKSARSDVVVRNQHSIMFVAPLDNSTLSVFHGLAPKPRGHEQHERAYLASNYVHLSPGEEMVVKGVVGTDSRQEQPIAFFYGPPLADFQPFGCTLSYWLMDSVPATGLPFAAMRYAHTERVDLRAVTLPPN
jgi:hypothetical protein